jgi:hypothetical protein
MSEIFISYARSTEAQAHQMAEALRALGYGVWRDDELPAHRAYSEVIEERLKAAKAVVVLWSAEAVKSHWVRAEADAAREAGTLVQMSVDGASPPMPLTRSSARIWPAGTATQVRQAGERSPKASPSWSAQPQWPPAPRCLDLARRRPCRRSRLSR